jgi:3-deoxy-D-manno-octulosonate 8-phosphate phosphatase (KDO 8-P phosphatase)
MTDGRIILAPMTGRFSSVEEIKEFDCRDGAGIRFWQRVGKQVAIISGRDSYAVNVRAKDLDIQHVKLGVKDKLPVYRELLEKLKLSADQSAVMGDDLPDLPMMLGAGLSLAPADAVEEVRQRAHHVTAAGGGRGAVREAIELILRRSGRWDEILRRYLAQMEPNP